MFDLTPQTVSALAAVDAEVERLKAARALIADKRRWCRDNIIRGKSGFERYCALGAYMHAAGISNDDLRQSCAWGQVQSLERAAYELYRSWPERVNDALGHAAVLKMYDRAITVAEAGK